MVFSIIFKKLSQKFSAIFVVGILKFLNRCPLLLQLVLARWIGLFLKFVFMILKRSKVIKANLNRCFPDLGDRERRKLTDQHLHSLGLSLIEVATIWYESPEVICQKVHIEGQEYLKEALAQGQGALLLMGHFTTLEMSIRLSIDFPTSALYFPLKNPYLEKILKKNRERFNGRIIANKNMRGILRELKSNRALYYLPDHHMVTKSSVFAPFFGRPLSTITATSRVAKLSGTTVLPTRTERLKAGKSYRIVIEPPLKDFPSGDDLQDATKINQIIEKWIHQSPEQYFWVHRRFKITPPGEKPLYT